MTNSHIEKMTGHVESIFDGLMGHWLVSSVKHSAPKDYRALVEKFRQDPVFIKQFNEACEFTVRDDVATLIKEEMK